jgi:hypothetical protein
MLTQIRFGTSGWRWLAGLLCCEMVAKRRKPLGEQLKDAM